MQYALKNDQRIEPSPKAKALCPICHTTVIAKCGTRRIHHWAHEGLKNCDSWKENETQWHRDWKNRFPSDWREYVQHDESGEKHIADIRTPHGLVLEFQHSHLEPKEREVRESFHKKIVWVVDGIRLKKDYPRFQNGLKNFKRTTTQGYYLSPNPEESFPALWLNCPVPVFFDFLGTVVTNAPDAIRNPLWQLLPGRREGNAVIVAMAREHFVEAASRPPQPIQTRQPLPQPPIQRATLNINALRQLDPQLFRKLMRPPRRPPFR